MQASEHANLSTNKQGNWNILQKGYIIDTNNFVVTIFIDSYLNDGYTKKMSVGKG